MAPPSTVTLVDNDKANEKDRQFNMKFQLEQLNSDVQELKEHLKSQEEGLQQIREDAAAAAAQAQAQALDVNKQLASAQEAATSRLADTVQVEVGRQLSALKEWLHETFRR